MLWMKAWLETRWRFVFALCLSLAAVALLWPSGAGGVKPAGNLMVTLSFFLIFTPVYLAGTGIRTQSGFQAMQGIHGSMYYTLSLPVSRFRLLWVRAAFGLLEMAGIDVIVIAAAWCVFPLLRAHSSWLDLLQLILAVIVCTACFFFVSVVLATVLGDSWQIFGSLFVVGVLGWVLERLALPPSWNVFHFGGDASPLITHMLPWPAMAISIGVSAILFFVALRIVQNRDY